MLMGKWVVVFFVVGKRFLLLICWLVGNWFWWKSGISLEMGWFFLICLFVDLNRKCCGNVLLFFFIYGLCWYIFELVFIVWVVFIVICVVCVKKFDWCLKLVFFFRWIIRIVGWWLMVSFLKWIFFYERKRLVLNMMVFIGIKIENNVIWLRIG